MTTSKRAGCKEGVQKPDTLMEDQEGPPQSWGARARMNKARAELEMARWAPELAGPGRVMVGEAEAKADSHLLWTR